MWLTFILVGSATAIFVLLAQKVPAALAVEHGWKTVASLLVVITLALAGFYFFSGPTTLGDNRWWQISPGREIVLFVLMLLGMAVRYLTEAIENRRDKLAQWKRAGSPGTPPGIEFDKWEFAYPLLISTITFGALLSQIKEDRFTLQNGLLSFQTGFFWQTLLTARASSPSTGIRSTSRAASAAKPNTD